MRWKTSIFEKVTSESRPLEGFPLLKQWPLFLSKILCENILGPKIKERDLGLSNTQSQTNSAAMSFQLLNTSQLHNRTANIPQAVLCELGTCNVLEIRTEVDARILLSVTVGG
jgi:hypothetical protein